PSRGERPFAPTWVFIQLMPPASGVPSILNPYPAMCPETVSDSSDRHYPKNVKLIYVLAKVE
ncbi:MAG: hypothetical protein ACK5S7_04590, partial [Dolichospermum sp.]